MNTIASAVVELVIAAVVGAVFAMHRVIAVSE
jgi:hypothetical protein